ncbi:MAG: DUF4423 domain-containing protein [Bdellovibrionota bacterium]
MVLYDDYINLDFQDESMTLSVTVDAHALSKSASDPGKFIGATRLKMASLISDGNIHDYIIHEENIKKAINHLEKNGSSLPIRLTVASGFPLIHGVSLHFDKEHQEFSLSITTPINELQQIRPEWIQLKAQKFLLDQGSNAIIIASDIFCAWYRRAYSLQPINDYKLNIQTKKSEGTESLPYRVTHNRVSKFIELTLNQPVIYNSPIMDKIKDDIQNSIQLLKKEPNFSGYCTTFNAQIKKTIRNSTKGYGRLNIGFPVTAVAALTHNCHSNHPNGLARDLYFVSQKMLKNPSVNDLKIDTLNNFFKHGQDQCRQEGLIHDEPPPASIRFTGIRSWSPSNRDYMGSTIDLCKNALEHIDAKKRDFQTMTLAITDDVATKITRQLDELRSDLIASASKEKNLDKLSIFSYQCYPLTKSKLDHEAIHLPSDYEQDKSWQKLVIRELIALDIFREDERWIKQKLIMPIKTENIRNVIDELIRNKFVYRDKKRGQRLTQTSKNLVVQGGNVGGVFLWKYHHLVLDMAKTIAMFSSTNRQHLAFYPVHVRCH